MTMKKRLWPHCALIWLAVYFGGAAWAQSSPASVNDPNVAVPPVVYRSVFADTPKGVETQTIDWKNANADVGQFRRGHVDILKWEEANPPSKPAMPGNPPANTPGTPNTPRGPTADMHKH